MTLVAWLRRWRRRRAEQVRGECWRAALDGATRFGLRPVVGLVACDRYAGIRRFIGYHWWLVDDAGRVLDPTAQQFLLSDHHRRTGARYVLALAELEYWPLLDQPTEPESWFLADHPAPTDEDDAIRWLAQVVGWREREDT